MPDDEAEPSSPGEAAPPDRGISARRVTEALSEAESMGLLATGGVGRLVYASRYGPVALPVEYVVYEGRVSALDLPGACCPCSSQALAARSRKWASLGAACSWEKFAAP